MGALEVALILFGVFGALLVLRVPVAFAARTLFHRRVAPRPSASGEAGAVAPTSQAR